MAAHLLPTNIPGAMSVAGPPAGFSPFTASNDALAAYGFPAKPDMLRHPDAYAVWHKAMSRALHRVAPVLSPSRIRHPSAGYSSNWSGAALTNLVTRYESGSFRSAWGIFNVPALARPNFTCNGWLYSSEWVGLDGANTTEVVQAGVDADSYCTSSMFTTSFRPWYEWYPNNGIYITNFSVSPGDKMVIIANGLSALEAQFFVEDATTGNYVITYLNAPSGYPYVGESAEWITERPEVNNATSTLADYGIVTYNTFAFDTNNIESTPGQPAWLVNSTLITMLDSNGYPLSVPSLRTVSEVSTVVTGTAK